MDINWSIKVQLGHTENTSWGRYVLFHVLYYTHLYRIYICAMLGISEYTLYDIFCMMLWPLLDYIL